MHRFAEILTTFIEFEEQCKNKVNFLALTCTGHFWLMSKTSILSSISHDMAYDSQLWKFEINWSSKSTWSNLVINGSLAISHLWVRLLAIIWKQTKLCKKGAFPFIILLQLRWPIESKFSQICYFMHMLGYTKREYWSFTSKGVQCLWNWAQPSPLPPSPTPTILVILWTHIFWFARQTSDKIKSGNSDLCSLVLVVIVKALVDDTDLAVCCQPSDVGQCL